MGSYKSNSSVRRHSVVAAEAIEQGKAICLDGYKYTVAGGHIGFCGFAISAVSIGETVEYEVAQNTYVQCLAGLTLTAGEEVGLDDSANVVPIAGATNTDLLVGTAGEDITIVATALETWINQKVDRLA